MEYTLEDAKDILYIRKTIHYDDEKEILASLNSNRKIIDFLMKFQKFEEVDLGFLLLKPSYFEKIQKLFSDIRFNTTNAEVVELINDHIRCFNEITSVNPIIIKAKLKKYLSTQEALHSIPFVILDDVPKLLADDYLFLMKLQNKEQLDFSIDQIQASVGFFLNIAPEVFEEEETREASIEKLNEASKQSNRIIQKIMMKLMVRDLKEKPENK